MTKLLKGFGVVVVAVALLAGVAVSSANALTQAEANDIITALGLSGAQADVINALVSGGSSSSASCALKNSPDLTIGSTGANVVDLQTYLESKGFLTIPAGVSKGYFGALTQSALAAYQASMGIAPAAGYFGPITKASIVCDVDAGDDDADDDSDDSSDLEGGAGSISDADFITNLKNEEVGEDEEDVEVAGLEIEAEGSDLELTAVGLNFDYADTGADNDLDDYASEVSVWFNGEEVARLDADEFDDDNNFAKTVSLDSGAIIEEDETGELVVAVSGLSSIDSANQGEKWNVSFTSVRFRDAQDAVVTESTQGDIGESDSDDDATTDADEREFSFEAFAASSNLELKISLEDDSVNEARVIDIDDTDDTDDVELLSVNVEVEGDSDILVKDLSVNFDSVGVSLEDAISSVSLWIDGDEVASENMTSDAGIDETIEFDDLDYTFDADSNTEVIVTANLKSTADGIANGDTIQASISAIERALIDAEDESGEDVATGDMTGTAVAEAHGLFAEGMMVELVSVTESVKAGDPATTGSADVQTVTIKFDATAFDSDVYVDKTAPDTTGGSTESDLDVTGSPTVAATITSTADEGTDGFLVDEGDTETFTVTVTLTATADEFVAVSLTNILYALTDVDGTTGYTFNLDDFESDPEYLEIY